MPGQTPSQTPSQTPGQTPERSPRRARAGRVAACLAAPLAVALAVALAGGCHADDWLQYSWDDRRIVCSHSIDDVKHHEPWGTIADTIDTAQRRSSVALLHAHVPGVTVSMERLLAVIERAERRGLDFVTYGDFEDGASPRPGLALAFDDHGVDAWFELRGLFAERGVRVTFFVSKYFTLTDEQRGKLAQLAADGHSIQAHSVRHLDARAYVDDHGLDAYLADEADPSIAVLRDAGYAPTTYAYPFGVSSAELDDEMLARVTRVRVGPRPCPY
jgi:hypothetical protein